MDSGIRENSREFVIRHRLPKSHDSSYAQVRKSDFTPGIADSLK